MSDERDSFTEKADRPLATIEVINSINPIPKADQIEVVTMKDLGWEVVVRKADNFKTGDLCIYCQIDSVLPAKNWCSFLEDRKYRIKTIRLRKQISQGIIFPISILKEYKIDDELVQGLDLTEILDVRQYVPPELRVKPRYVPKTGKKNLSLWQKIKNYFFIKKETRLRKKLIFPTNLMPKTKETRIQNSLSILTNHKDDLVSYTEKIDGMSMTILYLNGKFTLYSRNWRVSEHMNGIKMVQLYEAAFENERIKQKLQNLVGNYAIQGEIVGPGIEGSGKADNIYNLPQVQFFVFNVWDIDAQTYLDYFGFQHFVKKYKLRSVPPLGNFRLPETITEIVELSKGKSKVNPKIDREGIVVRSRDMNNGRWNFSFKCINPIYLLKYEG